MRLLITAALALTACSDAGGPPPEPGEGPAPAQASAAGEPMSTGLMGGISDGAAGDVSLLHIERERLAFANPDEAPTLSASTTFLGVVDSESAIAQGGASFSATAQRPPGLRVELRRIAGAAPEGLCWGDRPASYVALAHDTPLTAVTLLAFSGADAPGPAAQDSTFCAIYTYAVD